MMNGPQTACWRISSHENVNQPADFFSASLPFPFNLTQRAWSFQSLSHPRAQRHSGEPWGLNAYWIVEQERTLSPLTLETREPIIAVLEANPFSVASSILTASFPQLHFPGLTMTVFSLCIKNKKILRKYWSSQARWHKPLVLGLRRQKSNLV